MRAEMPAKCALMPTPASASASALPEESKTPAAAAGLSPGTSSGAPAADTPAERPGGGTDSLTLSGEATPNGHAPTSRPDPRDIAAGIARTKTLPYQPTKSPSDLLDEADRQRRALADLTATREP